MPRIYVLLDDYSRSAVFESRHGASYWIELNDLNILFDTGPHAAPVLHNMRELGLDPQDLDYVVLSHCHYDHTGGLLGVLRAVSRKIPVIAHPSIFRCALVLRPRLRYIGIPFTRRELEEASYLVLVADPLEIAEGVVTTGEVRGREEFERHGFDAYTISNGHLVRDEMIDDISLLIEARGRHVLITGCAHAGIVSIVKHVASLVGSVPKALVGGFHLSNASPERIKLTVSYLKKLGVEEVYAGHCTGLAAEAELLNAYGRSFKKLYSGMVIEL